MHADKSVGRQMDRSILRQRNFVARLTRTICLAYGHETCLVLHQFLAFFTAASASADKKRTSIVNHELIGFVDVANH